MASFKLCRRFITGTLEDDVPTCVLLEMCICASILIPEDYTRLNLLQYLEQYDSHSSIEGYDISTIRNITDEDIEANEQIIAKYTGGIGKLSRSTVKTGFRHLLNFDRSLKIEYIRGPKTRYNPESYDSCMLYSLCKEYNIPTKPSSTYDQMARALSVIALNKLGRINVPSILPADLFNIDICTLLLLKLRDEYVEENVKTSSLEYYARSIPKFMHSTIPINSHQEAIVVAAMYYSVNIISSSNPIQECILLQRGGAYIPFDSNFRSRYMINPDYYDITKTYTLQLEFLYDSKRISQFYTEEGYSESYTSIEAEDFKRETLRINFDKETFHQGRNPYSKNESSPILYEDIDDISPDEIVSFGNRAKMTCFMMKEISSHFNSSLKFTNPSNFQQVFSKTSINKLKNICRFTAINQGTNIQAIMGILEQRQSEASILLNSIDNVKSAQNRAFQKSNELKAYYKGSCERDRNDIRAFINNLLDCGMYMRGWKVSCQTYPLKSADTVSEPSLFDKIDFNVKCSMAALNVTVSRCPEPLRRILLDLSLINIDKYGGETVIIVATEESGRTVMNRLDIVEKGVGTSSCIRLSSNWIVSSAYFYRRSLGLDAGFDISDLAQIS